MHARNLGLAPSAGGSAFHRPPACHGFGPALLLPDGDDHGTDDAAAKAQADATAKAAAAADKAVAENGNESDRGYPENTPLTEMSAAQQAAYWKHQARKHEGTAKARSDYDDLKAKAAEFEKVQRAQMSEHEKAVEAARTEGRQAAGREANERAALAILRASLTARGRSKEQVDDLMAGINPASFVKDDDVDTDRVASYADNIAGPVTGGGRGPDHGQGARGSSTRATGVSAGADMFAAAHKRPAPTTS